MFLSVDSPDPTLDREHDAYDWLFVEDAAARLRWPEQQRLVRLAHRLLQDGVPPELVVAC